LLALYEVLGNLAEKGFSWRDFSKKIMTSEFYYDTVYPLIFKYYNGIVPFE